ncbi:MAG: hypothetical protein M3R59_07095 [Verrucomicrobiota bacterium]|nr:hypothetical protein [Verrucomicrobiota bacterium]
MKVHLKQIPSEGLQLAGEEDCPIEDLPNVRCLGPLRYDLEIGLSEGALWANGTLAQPVELQCDACLENFAHEIRVPAFALHTELHGPEAVDLTPFMREDILLNLPAYPRCDRDGGHVCKGPKAITADPISEVAAEEDKREHDWGALDRLKLRKR